MKPKIEKIFSVFEIIAPELVSLNCIYSEEDIYSEQDTFHQETMS